MKCYRSFCRIAQSNTYFLKFAKQFNRYNMFKTILIAIAFLGVAILLLGVKIFFTKDGKFPNGHVSGNKEMRKRGVTCAQSQDRAERRKL